MRYRIIETTYAGEVVYQVEKKTWLGWRKEETYSGSDIGGMYDDLLFKTVADAEAYIRNTSVGFTVVKEVEI